MADGGPYILVSRLGEGGMAEVFKAVKQGPDGWEKPIALKRILPHFADNAEFIRMLSEEARLHAHLDHPNVVQILDFFRHENTYMIALEYVSGKNLRTILYDAPKKMLQLPWQASVFIISEILKGLDYAHKRRSDQGPLNIIHRDISPQNILISYDGVVKLSDFGIAVGNIERERTETGILKGKHRYLSPEQLENKPLDSRADLFSTGLVLYEILCNQHPYDDENQFQMMKKIVQGDMKSSQTLRPDIPEPIHQTLAKILKKKPDDRFQDATQFRQALLTGQTQDWLASGHEKLQEWLTQLYPVPSERAERAIEKTPILSRHGSPIPTEVNPSASLLSIQTNAPTLITHAGFSQKKILRTTLLGAFLIISIWVSAKLYFLSNEKEDSKILASEEVAAWTPVPNVILPETETTIAPLPTRQIKKGTKIIGLPGKLKISGPRGASVFMNGTFIGDLPLLVDKESWQAGSYMLAVRPKTGKIFTRQIRINPKQTTKIEISVR